MQTIQQVIERDGIRIRAERADSNPNMDPEQPMNHYKVRLRNRAGRQLTVYFSMGLGLRGEPTAADVLECLASDAAGIENAQSFEDWAAEYGYDTDSHTAYRTYQTCQRQAKSLQRFMVRGYEALLFDTVIKDGTP